MKLNAEQREYLKKLREIEKRDGGVSNYLFELASDMGSDPREFSLACELGEIGAVEFKVDGDAVHAGELTSFGRSYERELRSAFRWRVADFVISAVVGSAFTLLTQALIALV